MDKKEIIHRMATQYFVIYNFTMIATIIFCHFGYPKMEMINISYLGQIVVFSLLGCLPTILYYSKDPNKPQNILLRDALHTLLLEIILLLAGYKIGMYHTIESGFAFCLTILIVDVFVRFTNYINDKHMAEEINKALKKRRG